MSEESETLVCDRLHEKFVKKGRNFPFKCSTMAKELGTNSYVVCGALKGLEKRGVVERTERSKTVTLWRTRFKTEGGSCG